MELELELRAKPMSLSKEVEQGLEKRAGARSWSKDL